ncbi:HNH endonuclease [Methylocaldum sp. 14B]|uniref:HNH endonuclease n=1 Tax=Methylocaldum sp. 14B TaxID=1912213 RepID=UPI00117E3117|nr:HNH endonuclease [Methylocaldum sp. 14B]
MTEIFRNIEEEVIHIAEIAHVISAGDAGPRSNQELTPEQRARYENLILLCPTCHTMIDKAEDKFPIEMLLDWKAMHKQRIADVFGVQRYESRKDVRQRIESLLSENAFIFHEYGPMTDERFNPESTLPNQWIRKIRSKIIPNNRKILSVCDANIHLLDEGERLLLIQFRQHVDDFEAKHLAGVDENGRQFPVGFEAIFMDSNYDVL